MAAITAGTAIALVGRKPFASIRRISAEREIRSFMRFTSEELLNSVEIGLHVIEGSASA